MKSTILILVFTLLSTTFAIESDSLSYSDSTTETSDSATVNDTTVNDLKKGIKEDESLKLSSKRNITVSPGWGLSFISKYKGFSKYINEFKADLISVNSQSLSDTSYTRWYRQNNDIYLDSNLTWFPLSISFEKDLSENISLGLQASYYYQKQKNNFLVYQKGTYKDSLNNDTFLYPDTQIIVGSSTDELRFFFIPTQIYLKFFVPPTIFSVKSYDFFSLSFGFILVPYSTLSYMHTHSLNDLFSDNTQAKYDRRSFEALGTPSFGYSIKLSTLRPISSKVSFGGELSLSTLTIKKFKEQERVLTEKDIYYKSDSTTPLEINIEQVSFSFLFGYHF